ncbi:MAG TPA: ATP-binding cassette domain-containing protein [Alphaproteobacteria bacterium]|nr:ATP-binding cassette domain-containing protein [Alphaproteobacteria bacterium]
MNETPKPASELPIEMRGLAVSSLQNPDFCVLKDINWTVAAGEFWVVGAPHDSGKTDFLVTTAGLMPPNGGHYKFYGNPTRIFDDSRLSDRLRIGFVFEQSQLFHYLTVAENVALPLAYHQNINVRAAIAAVDDLLEITELKAIADVWPPDLPQSWHKRAGLARALVLRPDILLADNPLGGLDSRHCHWWRRFLDQLSLGHKWLGQKPMTIVVTTDDFRHWRGDHFRFALLKEETLVPVGSWNQLVLSDDPLVKELLAESVAGAT